MAENAVVVIAAGRRLCLRVNITVVNLHAVAAADVDSVSCARPDFRVLNRDVGGFSDLNAVTAG